MWRLISLLSSPAVLARSTRIHRAKQQRHCHAVYIPYRSATSLHAFVWLANPTVNFPKGKNYLLVERKTAAGWQRVADDGDWNTRVRWQLKANAYVADLSWEVPQQTPLGEYRLSHFDFDAAASAVSGTSSEFEITKVEGK